MDEVEVTTDMVKTDMSKGWMMDHPELAGKYLADFFEKYPTDKWALTIQRSNFPGMWLTLCAKRK